MAYKSEFQYFVSTYVDFRFIYCFCIDKKTIKPNFMLFGSLLKNQIWKLYF